MRMKSARANSKGHQHMRSTQSVVLQEEKRRLPASASARGAGVCIKSRQLQATCAKLFEALLE